MKFLAVWSVRSGSVNWEFDSPEKANRKLFAAWTPPESLKIESLMLRADGEGGYAVVETDDTRDLLQIASAFAPWFEFEIVSVIDMLDGLQTIEHAVAWRSGVLGLASQ